MRPRFRSLRSLFSMLFLGSVGVMPSWASPTVSTVVPTPGSTVGSLNSISITFSEAVTGVEAADLEVAGAAPASVTGSGVGPYVFSFTQPLPGTISATWEPDHGIAGIGTGEFVPTGSWSYTLTDSIAPTVAKIGTSVAGQEMDAAFPTAGSTVSVLTEARVTFSETVSGVDAADLLINGVAASAVSGEGAGPYTFSFPQPADGAVNFTWASGHGVVDSSGLAFTGGSWSVTKAGTLGTVAITEFLVQNGGNPYLGPSFQIPVSSVFNAAAGGNSTFAVIVIPSAAWSATDDQDWITLSATSGTASVVVTVTAAANATGVARSGTVTVTSGNTSKTVTVNQPAVGETAPTVSSVAMTPAAATLTIGSQYSLRAQVTPANASPQTIAWTSSATAVATVSTQGIVTGVSAGTATITATSGGKTATCAITVTAIPRDENFDLSSWIELTNTGSTAVDLKGWSLSTEYTAANGVEPAQWEFDQWIFPARSLAAGARMIVWASAKDRKPASGHLHTNFSLDADGGDIALFTPNSPRTAPVSSFISYPSQRYDYSYGVQPDGQVRYFYPPTLTQSGYTLPTSAAPSPAPPSVPNGAANAPSNLTSALSTPHANIGRGYFNEPFSVILSAKEAGATLRYTLNGSQPSAGSQLYTGPIDITGTTVLRFAAFAEEAVPSPAVTQSYLFLNSVVNQPSPPYDNPANDTTGNADDANPDTPKVGEQSLPVAWGTNGTGSFPGLITNLASQQVPADYGVDPKVVNDPTRYDDSGVVNAAGKTNLERINEALRTLPMLSLVMKVEDMFGVGPQGLSSSGGLYPTASETDKTDRTKACSLELLETDGSTGFAVDCGIDLHGNASRAPYKNPKHGFTIRFKGKYGAGKLKAALFPDSPVREWNKMVLRGDFNSSWLHQDGGTQRPKGTRIRDAWSKDTFRDMGRMAGHHRYTNLFINGIYWGTYDLAEDQADDFASSYFGGAPEDYDVIDQGTLKSGTWTKYYAIKQLLGWTGATFTTAPAAATLTSAFTNANYEQIKALLDVPWFIDYMMFHYYTGHQDWGTTTDYNKNWYAIAHKNGKYKFLPWDQENLLWSEADNRVTGALYPPTAIQPRLVNNAEYKLDFADRVHRHMIAPGGALLPAANIARLTKWTSVMDADAMCLESARWGDYRYKVHAYQNAPFTDVYTWNGRWFENGAVVNKATAATNWTVEINRLKNTYFPARTNNVIGQFRTAGLYPTLNAPQFRDNASDALVGSSSVPAGWSLKMALPTPAPSGTTSAGTIYYTLDGNDPRVAYDTTGARTASALTYTSPVVINSTKTVKARCLNGTTWSALMEATFTVGSSLPLVRISEINYNPKSNQGGSASEFVELANFGSVDADVSNWYFEGIDFIIPFGTVLKPNTRLVIASNENTSTFATQYPGVIVAGYFGGTLSNAGERLDLFNKEGELVSSVEYGDSSPWPKAADGDGYSLELAVTDGDMQSAGSWQASASLKGTPGAPNSQPVVTQAFISGFATQATSSSVVHEGVTITNATALAVNLTGWSIKVANAPDILAGLTTVFDTTGTATITLPANGSVTFRGVLPDESGTLTLINAVNQPVDSVRYGPVLAPESISRTSRTAGWTTTATGTQASLRINEWFSNPAPGFNDWIEIMNTSATQSVDVRGLIVTCNGDSYQVTVPCVIGPGGYGRFWCDPSKISGDTLLLKLSASGGTLSLADTAGATIQTLSYLPQLEGTSNGYLPNGDTAQPVMFFALPSPGVANTPLAASAYVLNEVLVRNGLENTPWARRPAWIEVAGLGSLNGFALRTIGTTSQTWAFPAGTTETGFVRIWCDALHPASTAPSTALNSGFAITDSYDTWGVELLDNGVVVDRVTWGHQLIDKSLGKLGNDWQLLQVPTPAAINATAEGLGNVADLSLNEWAAPVSSSAGDSFFEIYNSGTQPIAMGGLWLGDEPSEVGRKKWQIPANTFISSQGHIAFAFNGHDSRPLRPNFGVDAEGEYLRLSQNDASLTPVSTVAFGALPVEASGGRLPDGSATLGTLSPTPGAANTAVPSTGPFFVLQPRDHIAAAGDVVQLIAAAANTSGNPISYQWYFNGQPLVDATFSNLNLTPLQIVAGGAYQCSATDSTGTTFSDPAEVMVISTYSLFASQLGLSTTGVGDADHDGLSDRLEFLHGTNPLELTVQPERSRHDLLSHLEPLVPSGSQIVLQVAVSGQAAYEAIQADISTTLVDWAATPPVTTTVVGILENGGKVLQLKFPAPTEAPRLYWRLRAE